MKFSKAQLESFIELYRQEFGEVLSEAEALEQATALVSIVKLTYEPMSKIDSEKYSLRKHREASKNVFHNSSMLGCGVFGCSIRHRKIIN